MQRDVLIEGVEADGSWLKERAFQFGDGLFETIAIIDEKPCLWDAHMARLSTGCRRLHLPQPDFELLAEEGRRLCAGHRQAVLKIFWTAGRSERGYRRPVPVVPQRMLQRTGWPDVRVGQGWNLRQCTHRIGENPALAGVKHLNRLDQVVARAEWEDPDIGEGLLLGQDGRVVCGTMSNIFVQQGQSLMTPAIEGSGIAGVVRDLALEIASKNHDPVRVQTVSLDDIRAADALFLSNSLIGLVRVKRYESTRYDPTIGEHALIAETRRQCHQSQPWGPVHE